LHSRVYFEPRFERCCYSGNIVMKASISRVCLGSLLMCVLTLSPVLTPKIHAAPFAKRFSFTQPSGIRIELWGQGDEFYAVFETLDGYTVVFEPTL